MRLDVEVAEFLDSRQLLCFYDLVPVCRGYFGDGICIGWFVGYNPTTHERDWQLLIGYEENGVWWLWIQGDRREYSGLPEVIDALEHFRDAIRLQPVY